MSGTHCIWETSSPYDIQSSSQSSDQKMPVDWPSLKSLAIRQLKCNWNLDSLRNGYHLLWWKHYLMLIDWPQSICYMVTSASERLKKSQLLAGNNFLWMRSNIRNPKWQWHCNFAICPLKIGWLESPTSFTLHVCSCRRQHSGKISSENKENCIKKTQVQ